MTVYREFVACMAAFLRGETHTPSLDASAWGKLYALAKRQSLLGALFTATDGCAMPDAVHDRLRRAGFLTLTRYETQQQVQAELCRVLTDVGVAHLLFKGAVLRRYYRTPAMRTMGDMDVAIPIACRETADAALLAAGFTSHLKIAEVWMYEKHGVYIELHTALRRFNRFTQDKEHYDELWSDARQKQELTHHLSDEAEAAYVIGHLASHFCGGGCGLRQLMDLAVLSERFPDPALWDGVLTRLKRTGLDDFARRLLWLCRTWFGCTVADEHILPLDSDTEEQFLRRLLDDGTFGTDDREMLSLMRRECRLQKRGGKLGTMVRWILPSPAYIRARYPYASKPLLLPAAYVHRLFDGVTKNRRMHTARLHYADEHKATLEAEVQFFESIGL